MPIYCNNLWQKLLMNLWAICTHKFRAQKKEFFYDFFGIIKNNVFFLHKFMPIYCINLWKKMIINLRAICTHYFMAKKSIFCRTHKKYQVFCHKFMPIYCINLWQKMIINLWAICTHKFMAKKRCIFMIFFGIKKIFVFFAINLCIFLALIYDKKWS